MVRFEDLQDLWQKQAAPVAVLDTAPLMRAVRRFNRRQYLIHFLKLTVITGLILSGWSQSARSLWARCGITVLLAGTAFMVTMDWRRQRAITSLNFADSSAEFVRKAMDRLSEERDPLRVHYWPIVLTAMVGVNLVYLGVLRNSTAFHRVSMHAFASVLPFAACSFGLRLRARRFEADFRPLLSRLKEMKKALEERSQ